MRVLSLIYIFIKSIPIFYTAGISDPTTHKTTGQDQYYTKQYKIGDYWNAYLIDDTSGVDFGSLPNNQLFKTISTTRQYILVMFEEQITVDDYLQFFCVFNDKNENIGGNTGKNQDRQLLYISNVTNYYSPYNGEFSMQVLTFSSVNDRAVASGQNTLDYVQYASPGSGYAFPTIQNSLVTLNRTLMRDIGVRYSHRQSYGLELLSSCYYYGRPIIQGQAPNQINNNEIFEQKVFASRRLFIAGNNDHSSTSVKNNGGLLAGINDKITTSSHPETTFYNLMDAKPTGYLNFKNWKEWLSTSLNLQANLFVTKDFKGMLAFDKTKATNSNGTAIGEAKFFWDSEWNINNISGNYNVDMSSNFKYKDPDTNLIIGSPTVDYSKISQKYMSAILNFNSVVFSSLIQMPYDSVQWLPFALSDIPLIDKLLNVLSLGIPIGFIINQNNQQYKKMLYFNGFMSAFFTNNLENIIGNGGLIPLNAFAIGKLLGANVSTTAMTMKLTDRISVYPWDPKTGHKLKTKEQISTVDLSQKKNNKVYILAEDTEFLDIASPLTNLDTEMQWNPTSNGVSDGSNYAYIIDTIVTQSLHQGEERHTFYSDNPFTYQGDYNELSIAQFRYKNKGALTSNAFNWTTLYKLNHDEYKETEETTFNYPANILPPSPQNIAKQIVIIPKNSTVDITLQHWDTLYKGENADILYSNNKWIEKNLSLIKPLEIDINFKDYLDPTLLINTFNDLKRYYKSIDVYLSYEYETDEWSSTSTKPFNNLNTGENFKSNKKQELLMKSYLLSELFYYTKENKLKIFENYEIKDDSQSIIQLKSYKGKATISAIPSNINNLYEISSDELYGYMWGYNFSTNANDIKHTYLGFYDNSTKEFKWKIQMFPITNQIQLVWHDKPYRYTDFYYSLSRSIINYKLIISKIVLNPR
ncbi:hypothetical protein [Spiroplasma endosymbiont of Nebria brevicollis]|uniref:hypothetical protein n=1 Tax=Spiroplasma endosymbiont of Nebria brevicollis TaxID=3066284 RepID=UPI00313F27F3